jgi:ABC-2 type transport system ATP-binding protein
MISSVTGRPDAIGTATESVAVQAAGLGKRYRRGLRGEHWALRDCTFDLPAGRVAALVGANAVGKTTLLSILAGLARPTEGSVQVEGGPPTDRDRSTSRIAFVSQDKPLYRRFTAADMLRLAGRLNRVWDQRKAEEWLDRFDVPLDRRCGTLSGGQRAQVALAVAVGSLPSVLLLDEPLSTIDPLGRVEVVRALLAEVADTNMTVLLSTHVVAELGGLADHLLLLVRGRLALNGDLDHLLERHVQYVGPRSDTPPGPGDVLRSSHADRQSRFLVRLPEPVRPTVAEPWTTRPVTLEDLVLVHMRADRQVAA